MWKFRKNSNKSQKKQYIMPRYLKQFKSSLHIVFLFFLNLNRNNKFNHSLRIFANSTPRVFPSHLFALIYIHLKLILNLSRWQIKGTHSSHSKWSSPQGVCPRSWHDCVQRICIWPHRPRDAVLSIKLHWWVDPWYHRAAQWRAGVNWSLRGTSWGMNRK